MTVTTKAPSGESVQARWRRPLMIGLAADAVGCALFLLLIGEVIPPLIVFGVVFAALAFATVRTERRWPQIVTMVAGVLFIAGNLPFIIEDLSHPESAAGFVPTWLLFIATLYVLVAAVMVFRRSEAPVRAPALGAIALVAIGVAGSAVASATVSDDALEQGDVVVVAEDVEYPDEVRVAEGSALFIENRDIFRHTFVVDDQNVKQELPGSTDRRVELTLDRGTYMFRCDVPGHEDMEGTLIVE